MKQITKFVYTLIVGAMCTFTTATFAGIQGSQHDMSASGTGQGGSTATDEVCVFCHTPHGADIDAPAPLWNRNLDTTVVYERYSALGTSTLDGLEAPVGSTSLACLSCHDGQQALDAVINAPGSGGYNIDGAVIGGGAGTFMTNTGTDPIPMLGTDLRNDHPVSIQYAGGACQGTTADCTPTAATGDPDFNVAQHESINGNDQWWVDTAVTGNQPNIREKTDMVLYARNDFTGAAGVGPSVECGSCHDPHNETTRSDVAPLSVAFLRIQNTGSQICLACHVK